MVTKKERLAALASAYKPAVDERTKLAGMRAAAAQAAPTPEPYVEEFPTGMPDIQGYLGAIESGKLPPGILKAGFTEGPLPEQYQKMLGNPDILGWRLVTDENGTQRIEVQTGTGTTQTFGARVGGAMPPSGGNTNVNNNTTLKTPEQLAADATAAANKAGRQSAYDLLYSQFKQYGLESLVESIKDLIQKDVSPSQFTIELRNSPAYLKRFAANAARVKAGYKALDEGTYLALEDSYQNLMRNYGLPSSYWEKGELGVQPSFEKLIAGNVDPVELEQRLVQAVDQIEKGPKEYMNAIKEFYPEISRSDLLSYVLDPENALKTIQSKVKAAQIGGEYMRAGLGTQVGRAEELARQGVTADIARASIPTIMETAQRGGELSSFYQNAGLGLYDQATAEEEIYNLGKAAEAKKKREKYVGLEQASFAGQYGGAQGALDRGRSGAY